MSNLNRQVRHTLWWTWSVIVVAGASGCAQQPNVAVDAARERYNAVIAEGTVANHAAVDLQDAQKTLQAAERQWNEEGNYEEANHLAYLTDRKLDLAQIQAEKVLAEQQAAALSGERKRAQLQARDDEIQRLQERLQARRVPQGVLVTLGDVLFDTARADLKSGALHNLAPLVEYLQQHPESSITIVGHTDSRGNASYNDALSQRRAEAVGMFLSSSGIAQQRIITRGAGSSLPVASNSTMAGRQQNRRVEVTVSDTSAAQRVEAWPSRRR